MERGQRKLFRKETGYIIRGLIWYFLVMILIAMGSTAVFLRGGMNRGEAEGAGYIIGVAAGVAVLFIRNILFGKKTDVFAETGKRMRFRTFAVFFGCLTAGSAVGIIVLAKKRGKLKSWFAENAEPKGYLRCAFTLPSVLILCVTDLLMGAGWRVTAIAPL